MFLKAFNAGGAPALLLLMLAIAGCERQNPVQAPVDQQQDEELRLIDDFEASLEAELSSLEKSNVTEITGPTVITESGNYKVVQDFSATSDAIVIQADKVRLDLNEHVITGPGNKAGQGIVLDGVSHVTVRNGTLRTFGAGVVLLESSKSIVKKVRVEGGDEVANPPAGIPPQIGILLVNSYKNLVRYNEFLDVNLGLFVRGGGSFENRLAHNLARAGDNGLLGICYNPAAGQGPAGPTEDLVRFNTLNRFGVGIQTSTGSAENEFNRNTIYFFNQAWNDFNGTNEFRNNRTMQVTP